MPTSPDHPDDGTPVRPFWRHPLTWVWLGCWVGSFAMTHMRVPAGTTLPPGGDKIIHFVAYFVLTLLGGRAAMGRRRTVTAAWAVGWAIVYAAYGVADEVIQGFVGRTPAVSDWLADACGVAVATAILIVYGRRSD